MITIPDFPKRADGSVVLEAVDAQQMTDYCIAMTIQLMEDPYVAIPEFLRLYDEYAHGALGLVFEVAMNVASRMTNHMITTAEQSDMAQLTGKLAYWIDGTKAVLSQRG